MNSIRQLADILVNLKYIDKAIELYEGAMDADKNSPLIDLPEICGENTKEFEETSGIKLRITYTELVSMSRLYFELGEYERCNVVLQIGILRVQGLNDEINVSLDNRNDIFNYLLVPIPLLTYLAVSYIYINIFEKCEVGIYLNFLLIIINFLFSKKLVNFILSNPADHYPKEYLLIADAYISKQMFNLAISVLDNLRMNENVNIEVFS